VEGLRQAGIEVFLFQIKGEPTTDLVADGVQAAREQGCNVVLGLGGGSVLDAGKAIAALVHNRSDLLEYLEVIGQGRPLSEPPVPFVAIPTTAGSGAEVTRNAVLASPGHRVKVSLRSPLMLPRLAVVDPELTYSLPPPLTASTGLDALTQVLEPYLCNSPNPLTDALCREGLGRVARSLRRACQEGRDPQAREDMAVASLFGGLALANARLGAVHGLAAPLGGRLAAPHGAICARLLPFVFGANLRALEKRASKSPLLLRFTEAARILTGKPGATAGDGLAWLEALATDLQVPSLSAHGLTEAAIPEVASQALKASSMKGNAISLSQGELEDILRQAK
jgi:alcohol dehydrogenase class IV